MMVTLSSCSLCHDSFLLAKEKKMGTITFSGYVRDNGYFKLEKCNSLTMRKKCLKYFVVAKQSEAERVKINGQPSRMVSTEELSKMRNKSSAKLKVIQGPKPSVNGVNLIQGIGYTLDPDFSFAAIAAPYAQLLDIRQKQQTGPKIVEEIRKQADDARSRTISMPYRIQRIEEFVKQLEEGDLKLRVRVLESERAARKATILQMATTYTVLGGTPTEHGSCM